MRATFVTVAVAVALLVSSEAFGFAQGHARGRGADALNTSSTGPTTSVPEPTAIFAVTSGLLLVGAAGWLIRRR